MVVLSNNDGCVIARSDEAKQLGMPMAAPIFKYRHLIKQHDIQVLSANFALYGDLSERFVNILRDFCPQTAVYSIDESFLFLEKLPTPQHYIDVGIALRKKVQQYIGIPTRVGWGKTKTLAKLGNHLAKNDPLKVCYVDHTDRALLQKIPVGEIWGIGKKLTEKLHQMGVMSADDFAHLPESSLRKQFTVTGQRTAHELRWIPCFPLHEISDEQKKSMMVSRSFSEDVSSFDELDRRIGLFVSSACEKFRQQGLKAIGIGVNIRTSPFKSPFYEKSLYLSLPQLSNDTPLMLKTAHRALRKIYKEHLPYKKAGILLTGLTPGSDQFSLLEQETENPKSLASIDLLNKKFGKGTVTFGSCGVANKTMASFSQRDKLSPAYTTKWADLPKVKVL